MTQMVRFNFRPSLTLGSALFWRVVDWCLREGANEFTLSVYGFDSVQSAQGRFAQIKELLQPYECSAAKRRKPSGCVWKDAEETPLWRLTYESVEVLKRNGLFNSKARRLKKEVEVGDFCLYRDGEPMLAVFKEEAPEVCVILRPEEVKLFQQDHLEIMGAYAPQDLWGKGDQTFSSFACD
ncbi:MAG TPA: hypothetical protein VGA01_13645 [Candidatus Binatia bacterium]